MFKIGTELWGWGGSVILVRHNLSIIPPAEHNFERNTLVSRVTPENIMLYFMSIITTDPSLQCKGSTFLSQLF